MGQDHAGESLSADRRIMSGRASLVRMSWFRSTMTELPRTFSTGVDFLSHWTVPKLNQWAGDVGLPADDAVLFACGSCAFAYGST
jgi:hypothetical protein